MRTQWRGKKGGKRISPPPLFSCESNLGDLPTPAAERSEKGTKMERRRRKKLESPDCILNRERLGHQPLCPYPPPPSKKKNLQSLLLPSPDPKKQKEIGLGGGKSAEAASFQEEEGISP